MEVSDQLHAPATLSPGTHRIGGWVGPGVGLDAVEKREILRCGESKPGRPARSYTHWAIPTHLLTYKQYFILYIIFSMIIFSLLSLFWKKIGLWDHVAVRACVCVRVRVCVARQRLGRNVTAVTNTHATIEELLVTSFSMRSVSYLGKYAISSSQNFLFKFDI
jgi:hypothetical protein